MTALHLHYVSNTHTCVTKGAVAERSEVLRVEREQHLSCIRQYHQNHLHPLQHGVNDEMVVYLDGGAIGKTRHHYQGQAGLQKKGFYNCNKFWFGCMMVVDIYLPRQFSQNFCQLSRPSCWWLWC